MKIKTLFQTTDISMSKDQEEDFLYQGRILRLGTKAGDNGSLHVVPIFYIYENSKIYIHTGPNSLKVRDIKKNSNVAMCVDVGEFYYDLKNIKMRGRARIVQDEDLAKNIAEKIQVKYLGSVSHPQAREYLAPSNYAVVEIDILKRYSEDFSRLISE